VLFVVKANNRLQVVVADNQEPLRDVGPGDTVIALATKALSQ
jgi:hypothetical protein